MQLIFARAGRLCWWSEKQVFEEYVLGVIILSEAKNLSWNTEERCFAEFYPELVEGDSTRHYANR